MKNTKICNKCSIEKELCEFHKSKNKTDGYRLTCKECRKDESKNRYLNNAEYFEKYKKDNRDKIIE